MEIISHGEFSEQKRFLEGLREETKGLHRAVESIPISVQLMREDVTKNDYCDYLCAMYNVVHRYEQSFHNNLKHYVPDIGDRRKTALLADDLNFLQATMNLDTSDSALRDSEAGKLLGAMYVLEGSTLGGMVIAKHVQQKLQLHKSAGASYFHGYGANTAAMWRSFIDQFSKVVVDNGWQTEATNGAKDAYQDIINQLNNFTRQQG